MTKAKALKPPRRRRKGMRNDELAKRLFGPEVVREVKREVGEPQEPDKTEESTKKPPTKNNGR